jgi:[acyl-carrier-protein] S-malonyltransferase
MAAVLGGEEAAVLEALARFDLVPANRNAAGQIVAAGAVSALDKLAEDREVTIAEPTATLLSNFDGQPVASAADAIDKLVAQLTRPVRWDLCTATMRERFENAENAAIVELPPAGTLVGIAKRELRGVPTHAVKSLADLDGLTSL